MERQTIKIGTVIELQGVKHRRSGNVVLDHVTLAVSAGEVVMVHGARGAGKTTLLAIAAGFMRPDAGSVLLGGRNIVELQPASLPFVRRNIGYLPPEPPLMRQESALENVMLALAVRGETVAAAEKEARQALALAGVSACAEKPVAQLSVGEKRLVALARALAGTPPVIILDDPTAGLDPADRERCAAAIRFARDAGAAVLCAPANEAFMDALDGDGTRRLVLHDGRFMGGAPAISLVGAKAAATPATAAWPFDPPREVARRR